MERYSPKQIAVRILDNAGAIQHSNSAQQFSTVVLQPQVYALCRRPSQLFVQVVLLSLRSLYAVDLNALPNNYFFKITKNHVTNS